MLNNAARCLGCGQSRSFLLLAFDKNIHVPVNIPDGEAGNSATGCRSERANIAMVTYLRLITLPQALPWQLCQLLDLMCQPHDRALWLRGDDTCLCFGCQLLLCQHLTGLLSAV